MRYIKFGKYYTADPQNWEELAYTLHNEEMFLSYDPSEPVVVTEKDIAALNAWLD